MAEAKAKAEDSLSTELASFEVEEEELMGRIDSLVASIIAA